MSLRTNASVAADVAEKPDSLMIIPSMGHPERERADEHVMEGVKDPGRDRQVVVP
jgi:hypothetical protein